MKLNYRVENTLKGFEVSLDVKPCIVTEEMIKWSMKTFDRNERDAKEICIEAAKNEIHWQFCKKNADLPGYISSMRNKLYAITDASEENRKDKINDAHKWLNTFFEADKKGVY